MGWRLMLPAAPPAPAQIPPVNPCNVPVVDAVCGGGGVVGDVVGGAAQAGFDAVAEKMAEGAQTLLVEVTTAWTRVPSTSTTSTEAIQALQGDLVQLTGLVAVLGLIVAAVKMAWSRRGEDMREALAGLLRMMLVGTAGVTVLTLGLEAGDEFSRWIIDRSTGGDFNVEEIFALQGLSSGLLFFLGLLGIITGLIQIAFLLVRSALVVVLAGAWQLSAAASITSAGAQTWKRVSGWLLAMVLYKPAAAICYAAAFRLLGSGSGTGSQILATVEGMLILVLAVVALPAMIRLIVPAAASMGGPSTGAAVAGGAALATGAVALAGGGAAPAGGAAAPAQPPGGGAAAGPAPGAAPHAGNGGGPGGAAPGTGGGRPPEGASARAPSTGAAGGGPSGGGGDGSADTTDSGAGGGPAPSGADGPGSSDGGGSGGGAAGAAGVMGAGGAAGAVEGAVPEGSDSDGD